MMFATCTFFLCTLASVSVSLSLLLLGPKNLDTRLIIEYIRAAELRGREIRGKRGVCRV